MTENGQTSSEERLILNARVTVYLDGLIITRFTEDKIGQAGILTTLNDHCLRILVRGKGQLGQVWPKRDSSGNIPHLPYDSLRKISALQLYIHDSENDFKFPQHGSAEPLNGDHEYKFNKLLNFCDLHNEALIRPKPNVLAPLKIPQGGFYTAQKTKFKKKKQKDPKFPDNSEEYGSLTGIAIDYNLSKRCYLILDAELPAGSQNPNPNLLPAIIPLEPGARYEVIIQNAPIVEGCTYDHSMHFRSFYDAFPDVKTGEQYILQLADPPEKPDRKDQYIKAYPNSPPCTSPRYSKAGNFDWDPNRPFPSSALDDDHHH
jgi:hypothetical protein